MNNNDRNAFYTSSPSYPSYPSYPPIPSYPSSSHDDLLSHNSQSSSTSSSHSAFEALLEAASQEHKSTSPRLEAPMKLPESVEVDFLGRKLKIAVVQSPSQGRMNGFAEYEGRTVDPPLVVRVGWVTTDAGATLNDNHVLVTRLSFHLRLHPAPTASDPLPLRSAATIRNPHCHFPPLQASTTASTSSPPTKRPPARRGRPPKHSTNWEQEPHLKNLCGTTTVTATSFTIPVVNPLSGRFPEEEEGLYAVWAHIGVRLNGDYVLSIVVSDLDASPLPTFESPSEPVAKVYTLPFTVYKQTEYPGVKETTPLTQLFIDQGMSYKRKPGSVITKKRKAESPRLEEDEEVDGEEEN